MQRLTAHRLCGGALRAAMIAVLVASAGAAGATESSHHSAKTTATKAVAAKAVKNNQWYGLAPNGVDSAGSGLALSRLDRANFDHSGTRGREDLGENPLYPEGPGNVSD